MEQQDRGNGDVSITFRKNKARVEISKNLSLDKVTDGNGDLGQYSLCSFVNHEGSSAASGHYTAVAKRQRPQRNSESKEAGITEWVSFDDSKTAITTLDTETSDFANQKNAYMCLYTLD